MEPYITPHKLISHALSELLSNSPLFRPYDGIRLKGGVIAVRFTPTPHRKNPSADWLSLNPSEDIIRPELCDGLISLKSSLMRPDEFKGIRLQLLDKDGKVLMEEEVSEQAIVFFRGLSDQMVRLAYPYELPL